MKWLVHFVGDVHQPLHNENLKVGGNGINVTFDGVPSNLHAAWDSKIPEKMLGGYTVKYTEKWAAELGKEIDGGKYKDEREEWLDGTDVGDGIESAMLWSRDANAFLCSTALLGGEVAVQGQEIGGAYYKAAVPVVQLQIARAGYRLAAWLNLAVTGSTGVGAASRALGPAQSTKKALVRRGDAQLEPWMKEARLARRRQGGIAGMLIEGAAREMMALAFEFI